MIMLDSIPLKEPRSVDTIAGPSTDAPIDTAFACVRVRPIFAILVGKERAYYKTRTPDRQVHQVGKTACMCTQHAASRFWVQMVSFYVL